MIQARLHEQEIRGAIGVPGEGDLVMEGVAALDEAGDRCLYWCRSDMVSRAREELAGRGGCILLVPSGAVADGPFGDCRLLEVRDPRAAVAKVLALIRRLGRQPAWVESREIAADAEISPQAVVEGDVRIAEGAVVGAFCTVGPDVSIGRGTVLHPGARIYPHVSIGEESVVGPNTVVGVEFAGFVRDETGHNVLMPQLAGVVIGSHVDIGPLTGIGSGALKPTTIEDHVKIGGLTGIGHGARLKRGASITSGVMIGGSAVVEADAWVGINATVRDSRRVGAGALVGMDVSVQRDLPDGAITGAPPPRVVERRSCGQ